MTTEKNLAIVDRETHDSSTYYVFDDGETHNPPTDLIFDDGEPLESNRHRTGMNVLIRSLQQLWCDRNDYFTGGNMFIYYSKLTGSTGIKTESKLPKLSRNEK